MLARLHALKDRLFLACIIAGTLFFVPGAFALGLGEVTLASSLNEPLDASLELTDTANLDENQIVIELGSQEDYERAGLERPPFLSGIEFEIELTGATGTVHLTTPDNVVEPFVNLIVSARWPNGRLLREYTLLVDLPTFAETPPTQPELPTVPDATEPAATADDSTDAPANPPAAEAARSGAGETGQSTDPYTVSPGDSLWEIARTVRPDNSVTVQQTMLAIQRNNPDAFVNNNINRVITGRVLRIPSLQEIQVVDQAVAVTEVNLQNSQLGAQPLARPGSNDGTVPLEDELSVLTNDPDAAESSSDLAATIAALENELLISEENLDRARLENEELNARLGSLEEEIGLLENLIALEDQRIAQLQAELATQSAATTDALAEAQQAVDALNALDNQPAASQGVVAKALEILQNNLVWIGLMVALILAVVGVLVLKSRRDDEAAEAYAFDPAMPVPADNSDQMRADRRDAAPVKAGLFASLLAPFRPPKDDGEDEEIEDDIYKGSGLADHAQDLPASDDSYSLDLHDSSSPDTVSNDDTGLRARAGVFGAATEIGPEQQATVNDDELARQAEAADIAAAAAAMAAMDAEAEQAAERDVTDADESAMGHTPDATGINAADGNAAADDAIEALAFTPGVESQPDANDASTNAAAPFDDETETFEFTLRDTPEPEDGTNSDSGADDAVEKFNFNLQETAAVESEYDSLPPGREQSGDDDTLPDFGELNFDDSMLPDDETDDYLTHHDLDECDTKLDLATAYEAMGEVDDAIEILDEVIAEGNQKQIETAERLKQSWLSA